MKREEAPYQIQTHAAGWGVLPITLSLSSVSVFYVEIYYYKIIYLYLLYM